jgi:predicted transcriptional regulator
MADLLLSESEYRMMDIIWDNAPVESGQLVKLCESRLSWKKSTTYTMLKKLCDKNIVMNTNSVVSVIAERDQVLSCESEHVVKRSFGGSLPAFVNAFLGNGKLSKKEADELINLIETHIKDKEQ